MTNPEEPGATDASRAGQSEMRAAVLRRHGEPPEFGARPVPRPADGQALIRVTAAPINPLDVLCASGTSYFGPPALPYVPGVQGVGTVVASGALPAGQRVWFSCEAGMAPGDGAMAELCAVPAEAALPVPDGVSDDLAAALGLSAVAAWMSLTWRGGLERGDHVVVLGASGTVGQVAVQAARLLGAGRVVAACRDATGRARASDLGADAVADLTAAAPSGSAPSGGAPSGSAASVSAVDTLAARLAEAGGGRVDLVIDPVWGLPAEAALRVLSPQGRLVNLGSAAGPRAGVDSATVRGRALSVLGYTNNALSAERKAAAFAEILGHAAAGRLTADRQTLPLTQAADAWARSGQSPRRKLVLAP